MTASLLWGLACLLAYALAIPLVMRLPGGLGPIARLFFCALAVNVLGCCAGWLFMEDWRFWQGGALYWCGFMILLDGFGAVHKSVSLEMLSNLSRCADYEVSFDVLREHGGGDSFSGRVGDLVASGMVMKNGVHYSLSVRGYRLARPILFVQRFFGLSRSGMYAWESRSSDHE